VGCSANISKYSGIMEREDAREEEMRDLVGDIELL
jgi:hypothetical protein